MAGIVILTPEQVNEKMKNVPTTTRTNKHTLIRHANVTALMAEDVKVGAGFVVTGEDEHKENGEPLTLAGILAAYNRVVKSRKLTEKISVKYDFSTDGSKVGVLVRRVK